mgnify:CR=1 FL=1
MSATTHENPYLKKKLARQRRNAVQSALGLLAQAESGFNVQTFTYLSAAISEIVPYIDIPIEEEYPSGSGQRVNLYRYIKVATNKYINRITLLPEKKNLEIKRVFISGSVVTSVLNHAYNNLFRERRL